MVERARCSIADASSREYRSFFKESGQRIEEEIARQFHKDGLGKYLAWKGHKFR